nr:hypothetical protein [Tanacetum cinerariifolium]
MLNKDNYVPWSSRLLCYAKSKPNRELLYNSITHGIYVRRIILEPGDLDREVPIAKTFHEQSDEELIEKDIKQMEADDQAIQTILMGLPEDIYAAVDMFHPTHPSQITYMQQPPPNNNCIPQPSFNTNYMQQPMPNPDEFNDPTTAMNMTLVLMAKAFKLNYSTPTNNNQRISLNPRNRQITQLGNHNGYNAVQNVGNQVAQNPVQNLSIQIVRNRNGLIVVSRNEEQYTRLLESINEPHLAQPNDNNVISEDSNMKHSGGTIDQNPATVEATRAYFESLYNNLVIKVEKVNTVNRKMREANVELTTELARYNGN